MRTSAKVFFSNNVSFVTEINGTADTLINYYLGKVFNLGSVEDNKQKCVKIVFDNFEVTAA